MFVNNYTGLRKPKRDLAFLSGNWYCSWQKICSTHLDGNVSLGCPLNFLLFRGPSSFLSCFMAELWRLLQNLRSPQCSEMPGARTEQGHVCFPRGTLCCSQGATSVRGGRKLIVSLIDVHRELSTLSNQIEVHYAWRSWSVIHRWRGVSQRDKRKSYLPVSRKGRWRCTSQVLKCSQHHFLHPGWWQGGLGPPLPPSN